MMEMDAIIRGGHRYTLIRIWDRSKPLLVVCMLNPSTADHERNDPTVKALIHFATLWGYGGLHIVNEYAFRASKPADMRKAVNPRGKFNFRYIDEALEYAAMTSGVALAAWGNDCEGTMFKKYASIHRLKVVALGFTNSGQPKHPMARGKHRIPRDQQPIDWIDYGREQRQAASRNR